MENNTKEDLKSASNLYQKILDILSLLLLLGMFLFLFLYWNRIPEKIATHYNFRGQADGFGGKNTLLLLPVLAILLYLLLMFVSRIPSAWNLPVRITPFNKHWVYQNVKSLLSTMKFCIMLTYAQLSYCSAVQKDAGFFPVLVILVMFVFLFYFIRRMKKLPPDKPEDYDFF